MYINPPGHHQLQNTFTKSFVKIIEGAMLRKDCVSLHKLLIR